MSTRAVFGFKQWGVTHFVYVHSDGYPTGAADKLKRTLKSGLTWGPGRFEADEWGAGFISANKDSAGGIRLAKSFSEFSGLDFYYEISAGDDSLNPGPVKLKAFCVTIDGGKHRKPFYSGEMSFFLEHASTIQDELSSNI